MQVCNLRAFHSAVAVLLANILLFAPLAPVAAQVVKVKRAPAPQQGTAQQGKGKNDGTGGAKNVTLPNLNAPAAVPVITAI